jgi:hypothetical protein
VTIELVTVTLPDKNAASSTRRLYARQLDRRRPDELRRSLQDPYRKSAKLARGSSHAVQFIRRAA